ncbi:MAG TPA: hypothetical protein VJ441_03165 [Dehalococcoidia bacterium]|nr:hypothetical protein [Dehalococcoidia bacterium]
MAKGGVNTPPAEPGFPAKSKILWGLFGKPRVAEVHCSHPLLSYYRYGYLALGKGIYRWYLGWF